MSEPKTPSHVCVLCNAKLESKEALQEHFRKHANREIDGKGRPRKPKTPGGSNYGPKKSVTSSSPRVTQVQQPASTGEAPAAAPSNSSSSSTNKNPVANNTGTSGGTKSPAKSTGIVCDVCGQEFETVTIAIQHKFKKHPDSAIKHFCPHCGQQFPLKINRDKHLQVHPSTPPSQLFPCQECGVVFYNAQAQNYHFKSTHKRIVAIFKPVETPPPSKKIRVNNAGEAQSVYYCHICGYEYIIKFNLQKHIERHHSEKERNAIPEGIIKCTTCDALFYSKKAYDNHNMYHRPDDLYVTSEEQRLQTVSRVDQDFDIRRVQPGPVKFIPVNRPRPSRVINLSLGKMDSKRRLSSKLKSRRANSQKARKRSRDDSSDETEESDTSSESELSPDFGPDSDSDSDVPVKTSVDKSKSGVTPQPGNSADDKTLKPVVGESKEDSKSQVRVKKKIKMDPEIKIKEESVEQSDAESGERKEEGANTLLREKCSKRVESNRLRKRKLNGGKGGDEEVNCLRISAAVKEEVSDDGCAPTRKGKQKLSSESMKTDGGPCLPSDDVSAEALHQEKVVDVKIKEEVMEDSNLCESEVPAHDTLTGVESQVEIKKESS
ncbi:hypothetical protein J437_LFUL010588 [Ladona fulva]|uniref:C2H2-type domain-containing protein n=1 Tax=Ladona fulva TaxID=123851 RepID=A0A8K0P3B1_LADFU|nr:hypothetical protein J437_LFUL010588 [Ladona fulva]